jgi:hypothetical protein
LRQGKPLIIIPLQGDGGIKKYGRPEGEKTFKVQTGSAPQGFTLTSRLAKSGVAFNIKNISARITPFFGKNEFGCPARKKSGNRL